MSKIIAIVSGGMDSVTMAHLLKGQGHDLHLLSVDYGQRHRVVQHRPPSGSVPRPIRARPPCDHHPATCTKRRSHHFDGSAFRPARTRGRDDRI
ncbi:7-cyano-7-deazaguanine synthase [Kitasatospora sp. NPDC059673]|uniref:7-cyano-7-deazaguanine synthase n=1 Tax=Kitasatospora sp. NPDC059673 TaxID=3346901 RepID=UPI0036823563